MSWLVQFARMGLLLLLLVPAMPAISETGAPSENQLETHDASSSGAGNNSVDTSPTLLANASHKNKPTVSETSNWPYVLMILAAMVVCILVMAWFVRRFSGMTGMGGRDLLVVNAIALGAREKIAVIDVKGQQFLVGITPHNISLLHAFDDAPIESKAPGQSDFADKLQKLLKGESLKTTTLSAGDSNEAAKQ